jgi:glycerol kinase
VGLGAQARSPIKEEIVAEHVLVIDEGTTGTRAVLVDRRSEIVAQAYKEFTQHSPAPDRVEHDPEEIWSATKDVCEEVMDRARGAGHELAAVAISNQRATSVLWDRRTGEPVDRAIVWQDSRTAGMVDSLAPEWGEKVYERTGLAFSPVYSSLMLAWWLDNDPALRGRAERGELAFGTIDSWLVWKLTAGATHAISASNASVTGAYDLTKNSWYGEWLEELGVPERVFPEVRDEAANYGLADEKLFGLDVPVTGVFADQQSALFGQGCFEAGTVKCTHGTGTFLDLNVGDELVVPKGGINSLIAWREGGKTTYALEGYAAVTGSAIQWLRDGAELIESAGETEGLAGSVPDNGGVYMVPALTGLSAPYWDSYARGLIIGINRGTKRAHLVRATLEGIVYAIKDFLEAMRKGADVPIKSIKTDGGAAGNDFLLQFQADILDVEVERPRDAEFTTSLGAAYMAGLATGVWKNREEVIANRSVDRTFQPAMDAGERDRLYHGWHEAVRRSSDWLRQSRVAT